MREYEIQLFYDPSKVRENFLSDIYRMFDLEPPPKEEIICFDARGRQKASTKFSTPHKERVLKLTEMVMEWPIMKIEINYDSWRYTFVGIDK